MENPNSNTNSKIDLQNVKVFNTQVDYIIFFASIILPFINETAIVLTKSGLSIFHNLYKSCIPDEIIEVLPASCKKNTNIVCSQSDTFRRLFIDAIAYLGIILNIGRNTLRYGYITGVVNGFVLIICSIVFPNLYLAEIIRKLKEIFNIDKPIMSIVIGIICIIILIFATKFLQNMSSNIFKNYKIDEINEPIVSNKIEQEIISYLE